MRILLTDAVPLVVTQFNYKLTLQLSPLFLLTDIFDKELPNGPVGV